MILLRWLVKLLREGPLQSPELGRTGQSLLGMGEHATRLQAIHDGACALLKLLFFRFCTEKDFG